jgi:hypothetical protein
MSMCLALIFTQCASILHLQFDPKSEPGVTEWAMAVM